MDALNSIPSELDLPEIAGWRGLWDSMDARIRLDTRKYVYDHLRGQAIRTLNHLHDKPIQHEVIVTVAETVRKVRLRKLEYERSRS